MTTSISIPAQSHHPSPSPRWQPATWDDYAVLGIPEYWVIDVRGRRFFAFQLVNGEYQACEQSQALAGLSIDLLEQTLAKLPAMTNISAAAWFAQQISSERTL